jgi:hypothetical protein
LQLVVGDDAGLRETIHAFADLNANVAVVDEWQEVVLVDDFLGDDVDKYAHVFVALRFGIEIKILNVETMNFTLGVERMLLNIILAAVMSAVGVLTL